MNLELYLRHIGPIPRSSSDLNRLIHSSIFDLTRLIVVRFRRVGTSMGTGCQTRKREQPAKQQNRANETRPSDQAGKE